jgi:epoxyqueuosine reductase
MKVNKLINSFESEFDLVGIIKTKRYLDAAIELNIAVPKNKYPTLVVLGLAYPKRIKKSNETETYASFYTFGKDYHVVLEDRINKVMEKIPFEYELDVDNHPHNERLAASIAGIGYFAKNQLIINQDYGSYIFLGLVFIDVEIEQEHILPNTGGCGDCHICIDACPTSALSDKGYDINRCISYYNQTKKILNDDEINANYCLFGCDICQLVCPKNINIKSFVHHEFELSSKEAVKYEDLFHLSERQFKNKYHDMAYLWKGKTILIRNALTILLRHKNTLYNDLIQESIDKHKMSWYQETAKKVLNRLESLEQK